MSVPEILKFLFGFVIWLAFAIYSIFFIGLDFVFWSNLMIINRLGHFKSINIGKRLAVIVL